MGLAFIVHSVYPFYMDVNLKCTADAPKPCRLVERLAGRAAGVGAIPETGPIECPCHRAFRQSHYLRFARLQLGLGREDGVRFEEILEQTRWPRPQGCQLERARTEELRELLAFRSEWHDFYRVPACERERLLHEVKVALFGLWAREDAQPRHAKSHPQPL
jgi:hypothetical protein